MIGYAFCGSFCTISASLAELQRMVGEGYEIQPIMSDAAFSTSTRFHEAEKLRERITEITGREIIHTVKDAEPLGPKNPLDYLIISPMTGNTLAKIANGITDTAVTMAAKAHLRCDRPLLVALASNDAMSQNLANIAKLITRRSVYFLPMRQDDPTGKPHSLVADFSRMGEAFTAMTEGRQIRPVFI